MFVFCYLNAQASIYPKPELFVTYSAFIRNFGSETMASHRNISCTIITKNEVERIEAVIKAAWKVADEILVVDSGSTDGTVELCASLGCRVIHNDWQGYGPQKRFCEDEAKHDWILNLDADEELSDVLIDELLALKIAEELTVAGYRFRTVNVYPGHKRPRLFADYHNYIRFYDKQVMRFPDSPVFDAIEPGNVPVEQLNGPCWHYSMKSIEHLVAKIDRYTDLQATVIKRPIWQIIPRIPFEYPAQFLKIYFLRRHFTGGFFGLQFAHEMSKSKVRRLFKIWKANN